MQQVSRTPSAAPCGPDQITVVGGHSVTKAIAAPKLLFRNETLLYHSNYLTQ